MVADERLKEIVDYALDNGDEKTIDTYSLTTETLSRYKREYRKRFNEEITKRATMRRLSERYDEKELQAILKSGEIDRAEIETYIDFTGEVLTLGIMSDLHIGSIYSSKQRIHSAFQEIERSGADYILMPGDITEGMSNRAGHVYELSEIGYHEQREKAVEILSFAPVPVYAIDGNHDRWFIKSNGAKIVSDIADRIDHFNYCGHDNATLRVKGTRIMLWHGEDGSSYAHSYRPQKIIESISGGKKPNIICAGHDHKSLYLFDRNIHFISSGTIQEQTAWMRGKRLVAHTGFWIVKAVLSDGEVKSMTTTWYPFYK